ncbi:hypothetical protein P43SY_003872 [Pythium insidiosum]|uniref:Kinesin motor domain-containing protein n=1 Tax=Pythium insidiosum TaxID=114742 RepID=A0AAD5LGT4_PYTIN|nr:hypothetical protein P43SY_003872 [Pythium insidiosum]
MEASAYGRSSRVDAVDAVKVCVRVRPLNAKERQEQTKNCLRLAASPDGLSSPGEAHSQPQQIIVGKDRAFTFDAVFGVDTAQHQVFRAAVEPLVDCFMQGYNATVLAYGQTGTGKTHTMTGDTGDPKGGARSDEQQGIIPRVVRAIFAKMQEAQQRTEFTLRVEYIEIYNEELRDLLHPDTPSKQLAIREDGEGNIVTAGVKSQVATSKDAVLRLLVLGGASRVTGSTLMNEQSSRSHAIFSLILQQRDLQTGECRKAKFHLVDLAGSERAKRTGAVAGRFKESVSINQGLLALGNVISALSEERKKPAGGAATMTANGSTAGAVHVPYRDSKLTRLLQDSLGGNAKTLMIACVSPAAINFEETLNTLKYANRAKNIKNRPIVNQQTHEEKQRAENEIARMKEEIALLQSQLQVNQLQQQAASLPSSAAGSRPDTAASMTSASGGRRRHSVATSTRTSLQESMANEQDISSLKSRCRGLSETVEDMRAHNLEAITALVALERDIKSLGRPVQQRLNEIVKHLNSAIQSANRTATLRRSRDGPPLENEPTQDDAESVDHEAHRRVCKELEQAKTDLARDEQIFEMKNTELKRLHALLAEAKEKNELLIQRVQNLERSGQLWSNAGSMTAATTSAAALPVLQPSGPEVQEDDARSPAVKRAESSHAMVTSPQSNQGHTASPSGRESAVSKRSTSSRGLFTKRTGTAGFEPEEDNVLIGTAEDEERETPAQQGKRTSSLSAPTVRRGSLTGRATATAAASVPVPRDDAVAKMEKTIAALQAKVEELQQQNGELVHGREESTLRWQLERQQYERQLNDAETTIETLRKATQALEDTLLEADAGSRSSTLKQSTVSSVSRLRGSKTAAAEIVLEEREQQKSPVPTPPPVDEKALLELYETSIRRLVEYQHARRNVLALMKEKKKTQLDKEEASRRLNSLEMQKLRQSLTVRESIVDLSESLRVINEKMQHEHKTREELERLKKLRERAERKLTTLRRQEEQDQFLSKDAAQEATDLEELIEDLTSHISFQDSELQTAREELELTKQRAQVDGESPLDGLTKALARQLHGDTAAFTLIQRCLEDIARLRVTEDELRHELTARSAAVDERDNAIQQLQHGLKAARKEFDRRLQLQQQESHEMAGALQRRIDELTAALEREDQKQKLQPKTLLEPEDGAAVKDTEWQKLIVSNQKKDEYISELEKHVVFYKSKAKQLQVQLQQLIRDSVSGNQLDHDDEVVRLQRRVHQLEESNDILLKDLAAAKVYLRVSQNRTPADGGIHVVRLGQLAEEHGSDSIDSDREGSSASGDHEPHATENEKDDGDGDGSEPADEEDEDEGSDTEASRIGTSAMQYARVL